METFKKIDSTEFINQIIVNKADALVKITNDWNGSAQLMSRTLEGLAQQYEGKVDFFQMDGDAESSLVSTYRVESIPTILFFKKGTLVDKLTGLAQRAVISNKIYQLIYA